MIYLNTLDNVAPPPRAKLHTNKAAIGCRDPNSHVKEKRNIRENLLENGS
jgi:hypothetical protein